MPRIEHQEKDFEREEREEMRLKWYASFLILCLLLFTCLFFIFLFFISLSFFASMPDVLYLNSFKVWTWVRIGSQKKSHTSSLQEKRWRWWEKMHVIRSLAAGNRREWYRLHIKCSHSMRDTLQVVTPAELLVKQHTFASILHLLLLRENKHEGRGGTGFKGKVTRRN